jgi:ppGpp synthetase/RelA/SpoT-type nucleotidyltranferase
MNFKNFVILMEELDLVAFRYFAVFERKEPVVNFNPFVDITRKFNETDEEFEKRIAEKLQKIKDKLEDAKKEYNRLIKKNAPSSAKFLIDVKSVESIISKIKRGKEADKITDILRGAILCKTKEDVEDVVKKLKRNAHIYSHEYKAPGMDEKYGYYGSHHFIVQVGDGYLAEIQVMTKKLWAYKYEAHKIYNKYREGKLDQYFDSEIKRSKELFRLGNK